MSKLPENLKRLRRMRGIKQEALARGLNLSTGTISNYENGRHEPDFDCLVRLADFYGVSADYLLGRTDCPWPVERTPKVVYGKYTVGRFLRLLGCMPEKDRAFLAHGFRLLEKLVAPKQEP